MYQVRLATATLFAAIVFSMLHGTVNAQCPNNTMPQETGQLDYNGNPVVTCVAAGQYGPEGEFYGQAVGVTKWNTDIFPDEASVPRGRGPYRIGEPWPNKIATVPAGSTMVIGEEIDRLGLDAVKVQDGNVRGYARKRDLTNTDDLEPAAEWEGRLLSGGEGACGVGYSLVIGLGCVHTETYYKVAPAAYNNGLNGPGRVRGSDFGSYQSGAGMFYNTVQAVPPQPANSIYSAACDCWTLQH